jgi:hypothetical protein
VLLDRVTLDWCEPCGALFFDPGELEQLRASRPAPLLGEFFLCDACQQRKHPSLRFVHGTRTWCQECVDKVQEAPLSGEEKAYREAVRHAGEERAAELDPWLRRKRSRGNDPLGRLGLGDEYTSESLLEVLFSWFS